MKLSATQGYFIIIFGIYLYAYYLYNWIGDEYGKSENKCGGLTEYGYKCGTMILNTMMFICCSCVSGEIVNFMNISREYYKKNLDNEWPKLLNRSYHTNSISVNMGIMFIFHFPVLIGLIINLIIGNRNSCFRNNFTTLYHYHILITCTLNIMLVVNICFVKICNNIENDRIPKTFYSTSLKYKKIDSKYKIVFTFGTLCLHFVSLYLFENINGTDETRNYINLIFWLGHFIDSLNLIVLFYDNYADLTIGILTTLVLINDFIIVIFLSTSVNNLSYNTILLLGFSNIFIGWCIYDVMRYILVKMGFVLKLSLVYSSIGIITFFCYLVILSGPIIFLLVVYIFTGLMWSINFMLGCGLETHEDGRYFQNILNENWEIVQPYFIFTNRIIETYVSFLIKEPVTEHQTIPTNDPSVGSEPSEQDNKNIVTIGELTENCTV